MFLNRNHQILTNFLFHYISWCFTWSSANSRCPNYIFILRFTLGFDILHMDHCKPRWETIKIWDLVRLILEILRCVIGAPASPGRALASSCWDIPCLEREGTISTSFQKLHGVGWMDPRVYVSEIDRSMSLWSRVCVLNNTCASWPWTVVTATLWLTNWHKNKPSIIKY